METRDIKQLSAVDPRTALTSAWTQLNYHSVQNELWRCTKRWVGVAAGRGSGKTELAKRRLVRFLPVRKPWPDPKYFYGAPTEQQAKRIAWHHLVNLTPRSWIKDIDKSELRIVTVFGSTLQVVGLDKPQRIEGVQWDGCVIDESCDIKPGTIDLSIKPALVWRKGWCWRIGVPKRHGVGAAEFKSFCDLARRGRVEDGVSFTWPSEEIVPAESLAAVRATMDIRDYQEQFGGLFLSAAGGIFYSFDEDYNVRPCPYRPDLPILVGSDFNVDPMAWVLCHRYMDRLEVFDMVWMRDTNTPAVLAALKHRYGHHRGGFQFYGDASGKARRTSSVLSDLALIMNDHDFKRLGRTVHYTRSNPPVADRFAATNAMILNAAGARRLFIDPRCRPLIDDFKLRAHKPGTREPAKQKDIGHASDALGYIVHKLYPIKVNIDGRYEVAVSGV